MHCNVLLIINSICRGHNVPAIFSDGYFSMKKGSELSENQKKIWFSQATLSSNIQDPRSIRVKPFNFWKFIHLFCSRPLIGKSLTKLRILELTQYRPIDYFSNQSIPIPLLKLIYELFFGLWLVIFESLNLWEEEYFIREQVIFACSSASP